MSFDELFRRANGRAWTADEERAFLALDQPARNEAVKRLAAAAPGIRTEDQIGSDGVVYTAFWVEGEGAP